MTYWKNGNTENIWQGLASIKSRYLSTYLPIYLDSDSGHVCQSLSQIDKDRESQSLPNM